MGREYFKNLGKRILWLIPLGIVSYVVFFGLILLLASGGIAWVGSLCELVLESDSTVMHCVEKFTVYGTFGLAALGALVIFNVFSNRSFTFANFLKNSIECALVLLVAYVYVIIM